LVRGFVALIAGSAIMVIPDMARTLLLLPVAMAVSILGLAVFGILDSVLVFVTSYMTGSAHAKTALRVQGAIGVAVGVLLYRVFFDYIQMHWFLILIAIQSLATAVAEFVVARHSMTRAASRWNFAAAVVAFAFSCGYFYIVFALAAQMGPQQITWLVFAYLLALGIAQCLTAARMLYGDYRADLADGNSGGGA
jgi:hypothetical protein